MTPPTSTARQGVENENTSNENIGRRPPYTQGYTCNGITKNLKNILSLMASPITDETGSRKSVAAGLTTIFVAGACIGLATPKNPVLTPPYQSISAALGYIYFMAWR